MQHAWTPGLLFSYGTLQLTETFPAKHTISISSTACCWHTADGTHATEANITSVNSGYSQGPPPAPKNRLFEI